MKKIVLSLSLVLFLSGCIDAAYDSARWLKSNTTRQSVRHLAMAGDVGAAYETGKLYCCGARPKYNNVEALYWFCKAAKGGQRDAMYKVADIYEHANLDEGGIIPKDDILAYVFYKKAAENDKRGAAKKRDELGSKLSRLDLERAGILLDRWPNVSCEIKR